MTCAMLDPHDRVAGSSPLSSVHGPGLDYVRETGEVSINGPSGAPGSIHGDVIYTTPISLP